VVCTRTADCGGGAVCQQAKLCIRPKTLSGGRRRVSPPPVVESVTASCAGGRKCAEGTCQTLRVCVPKAAKSLKRTLALAGCGCAVGEAGVVGWPLLPALTIVALALGRWRRQRR
jgi:hypothetical protein